MKTMSFIGIVMVLIVLIRVPGLTEGRYHGKGAFQLDIDMSKYLGSDSLVYLELYYGIREHILTYKPDSTGYFGGVTMRMTVLQDSVVLINKHWSVPHSITDTNALSTGKSLVGMESTYLKPGSYRIVIVTTDINNPARTDSFSTPITVRPFPPHDEAFSDIELCTTIAPASDSTGMFYKNTLDVVPNASMLYGTGLPLVYYYTEGYNLTNPSHTGDAIIQTTVLDGAGKEVFHQSKVKKRVHPSVVEYGKINIAGFRGGTYILRIALTDSLQHIFASTAKKFFVYRPGAVDSFAVTPGAGSSADFTTSEYATMTGDSIDHEFAFAKYIATETERKQFENLQSLEARRKFLFEFWKYRNPNPGLGRNDVKMEYMNRVRYVNDHFGRGFRQGWQTDRGRVYVVYGPYDEIEEFPSNAETNPYQIWHYNAIQGGVIFVFVDRDGLGQYQLVHSTHRDELHDENWYNEYAVKTN